MIDRVAELQQRLELLDGWAKRIERIRLLRKLAREPHPEELRTARSNDAKYDRFDRAACEASHPLRHQAFTGRSDLRPDGSKGTVFQFGKPHFRMAADLWVAEQKAFFFYGRIYFFREGRSKHTAVRWSSAYNGARNAADYVGMMMILPPRHGKTAFLRHWVSLRASQYMRLQSAYIHGRDVEASKFVRYVSDMFAGDTGAGRRHKSLFPDLMLSKIDNTQSKIRLQVDDPPSNPTLIGSGIGASAQGNNLDLLVADDIVGKDDQSSPTTREQTKMSLRGTWMTRVQGKDGGFRIFAGYPWHQDDAIYDLMELADEAKRSNGQRGIRLRVCKMAVGGPEDNFRPIWPDVCDRKFLKSKYQEIGAPTYAAQYQMKPLTDDMKIVKQVRLYDPKPMTDEDQHNRFVDSCEIHVSVDPSFTNTANSDMAGVVVVGVGSLEERTTSDTGTIKSNVRTVIRVLEVVEMKSTQSEMTSYLLAKAQSMPIHALHVETTGGGGALVQMLEDAGITSNVVSHTTGGKNKEVRLRRVAMLLEDGAPGLRARVEFPGKRDDDTYTDSGVRKAGELRPDKSIKRLIDYVENFRVSSGYHSLDALTQVVAHIGAEHGFSGGTEISEQAKTAMKGLHQIGRMRAHLREMNRQHTMPVDRVLPRSDFGSMLGGRGV
jgi:hypothetical protein